MKLRKIQTNKGSLMDVPLWIIVSFVVILFFAMWKFAFGQITDTLIGTDAPIGTTNLSQISTDVFGPINAGLEFLETIAVLIIFALGFSIFISNFLVKAHPAFYFVFVLMAVISVVFSVYVSNAYEDLLSNVNIGETLQGFTGGTFIMLNLPIWVTVFSIGGAVFLFIQIIKVKDAGGVV